MTPDIIAVPTVGDTAAGGFVLGGWIMTQIDHAAGRAGRLFVGPCLIRAIHELSFHAPLAAGEDLSIFATVGKTGRTSFRLEVEAVALDRTDARKVIATASITMICIDDAGQPRPIAG